METTEEQPLSPKHWREALSPEERTRLEAAERVSVISRLAKHRKKLARYYPELAEQIDALQEEAIRDFQRINSGESGWLLSNLFRGWGKDKSR